MFIQLIKTQYCHTHSRLNHKRAKPCMQICIVYFSTLTVHRRSCNKLNSCSLAFNMQTNFILHGVFLISKNNRTPIVRISVTLIIRVYHDETVLLEYIILSYMTYNEAGKVPIMLYTPCKFLIQTFSLSEQLLENC